MEYGTTAWANLRHKVATLAQGWIYTHGMDKVSDATFFSYFKGGQQKKN